MKTISPKLITVVRALHEAVTRMDAVLCNIKVSENAEDAALAEILGEAGKEAASVAYNAFESLSDLGIDFSVAAGESPTFADAFAQLKAAPLVARPKAA